MTLALSWTQIAPTAPGIYWHRTVTAHRHGITALSLIIRDDDGLKVCSPDNIEPLADWIRRSGTEHEWGGPIPEPREAL